MPFILDYPYRIVIIDGSGSGKTNTLLNLISQQHDINKIYLYAKELSEPKYEYLIKKREDAGIKHLEDPNAFIECSNTIMFDDMIADIMTNKEFQAIIKELLIRCRKHKYFTCVYHSVLFSCSKRCQIKFNTLFDY